MKQISSVEISCLLKELGLLLKSRADKVYQSGNDQLLFQFYVSGKGKKLLKVIIGKTLFLTDEKEEYDEPSSFCMFLRKHLSNSKLKEINQKESERIVELVFEKEEIKKLVIELFGGGNIMLCDKDDVILSALSYHKFKQRSVLPKVKYEYPRSRVNIFKLKTDELEEIFKNSDKENIVKCIAVELGLGGVYSEEACLIAKIDKLKKPKEADPGKILDAIKEIEKKKISPMVIYDKKEIIDVVPFDLGFYKNLEKEKFDSFSKAIEFYFNRFSEKKKSRYDKQLDKLNKIIEKQKLKVAELEKKEAEERKKAELIYNNYNLVKGVIDELNRISKTHSWKEIKEKLKNHKIIKEVDGKEKKVVLEL